MIKLIEKSRQLEQERINILKGLNDLNEQKRLNQIYNYKQNQMRREILELQEKNIFSLSTYK